MTPQEVAALRTAVARGQAHLQTVRDDLNIAHLAGELQGTRAAVAAAMVTLNSVAGDLAEIGTLIPVPTPVVAAAKRRVEPDDEPDEEIVTPLAT